jgi:hypothetical protein
MPPARHRAAGSGRYVSLAPARPRHALPTADRAMRRDLLAGGAVAVVLCTGGAGLGAVAANLRSVDTAPEAGVPLPVISIPVPAVPLALGAKTGVGQTAKVRPPIYLGPLGGTQLTWYCRAHAGTARGRVGAVVTDDGWACGAAGKPLGMNAVCRWWYGNAAWAGMIDDNDPDTWRCYRDPS